jgi:Hydrogenase maturation factor
MANEGKLILILPGDQTEEALHLMHITRYGEAAKVIGQVLESSKGQVWLQTPFGTTRVLEMLAGEMLPRIC